MEPLIKSLNIQNRAQAVNLVQNLEGPLAERPSLYSVVMQVVKSVTAFLRRSSDLNLEEWRRLEYRNELATREGERMNHFGIR
jgi:hypothetical protein